MAEGGFDLATTLTSVWSQITSALNTITSNPIAAFAAVVPLAGMVIVVAKKFLPKRSGR
jgi:hypothetical protein